jgi:hypothetical protein
MTAQIADYRNRHLFNALTPLSKLSFSKMSEKGLRLWWDEGEK